MKVMAVQVGLTTRCNSNCFFCFREELKRAGRKEGNIDFPIEGIEKIIQQDIKDIQLCCNRGEAIFHPEIDTIINMIKSSGSRFEMNTNGSRFNSNWWYDLGQKMTEGDQVIFALDGLKNTHEYYRNTSWLKVIENLKAFIAGGGTAIWQMILFEHNEWQREIVENLSKSLGCTETWIINSRYYNSKYRKPKKEYGKTKEDILLEDKPKNIICRFHMGERVYIDVNGGVWPCCFMRCHFGFKERSYPNSSVRRLFKEQEKFHNVLNTPLDEIVEKSKMFKHVFDHMNDESVPHDDDLDRSFFVNINKPVMYRNPYNGCLARHPGTMVNFACQLYCNDTIDNGNRRIIEN
jgi:MoaA/NifB/PqqE/SkfB family radical SAM enzyme